MGNQLLADGFRHYHQTAFSIACSTSSASQSGADRYFQPPSANTVTTTPSSSSSASRRGAWSTPAEGAPGARPPAAQSRDADPPVELLRQSAGDVDHAARGDPGEDPLLLEECAHAGDRLSIGHEQLPVELGNVGDRGRAAAPE